jgi:hypothetical protein
MATGPVVSYNFLTHLNLCERQPIKGTAETVDWPFQTAADESKSRAFEVLPQSSWSGRETKKKSDISSVLWTFQGNSPYISQKDEKRPQLPSSALNRRALIVVISLQMRTF